MKQFIAMEDRDAQWFCLELQHDDETYKVVSGPYVSKWLATQDVKYFEKGVKPLGSS